MKSPLEQNTAIAKQLEGIIVLLNCYYNVISLVSTGLDQKH